MWGKHVVEALEQLSDSISRNDRGRCLPLPLGLQLQHAVQLFAAIYRCRYGGGLARWI